MSFLPCDPAPYAHVFPAVISYWRKVDDGIACFADGEPTTPVLTFSDAELASLHPDFPTRLASAAQFFMFYGRSVLQPAILHAQLHHLLQPTYVMESNGTELLVLDTRSVSWDGRSATLSLQVACCLLLNSVPEPRADGTGTTWHPVAPFVNLPALEYVPVNVSWMEQKAPGWRERYLTGIALELTGRDLVRYSCTVTHPMSSVQLPVLDRD